MNLLRRRLLAAAWLGILAAGLALLGIVYSFVLRLATDAWVPGWTLTFIGILFPGSIQLLLIGILGEYVGRVYCEVKHRPLYLVKGGSASPVSSHRRARRVNSVRPRRDSRFAWLLARGLCLKAMGRRLLSQEVGIKPPSHCSIGIVRSVPSMFAH